MHQPSCSAIWRVELSLNADRIQIDLTLKQFKVIQGHRSWCEWKAYV